MSARSQASQRRNAVLNTMGQYASSKPPVSLTVEPVPYARSVKHMVPPPKNLVVSVLSCIPCLPALPKSRLRAFLPRPPSPSLGRLVTRSSSPSLDRMATKSPGYGESAICCTACLATFTSLAGTASPLGHDLATTAHTQCTTKERPTGRDYCLWALGSLCSVPRFADRLS